jgi:alpha-beta hydrolase superfamily lysophospholipase
MTGVKEQVVGHYAEDIARAGYITLALDHRHFGESEGMQADSMRILLKKWRILKML